MFPEKDLWEKQFRDTGIEIDFNVILEREDMTQGSECVCIRHWNPTGNQDILVLWSSCFYPLEMWHVPPLPVFYPLVFPVFLSDGDAEFHLGTCSPRVETHPDEVLLLHTEVVVCVNF